MDTVVVNQDSEPWVASFSGVGAVYINADGTVTVEVADTTEPGDTTGPADTDAGNRRQRHDALKYGWGETLSLIRRGFRLVAGTALVAPRRRGCVIFVGSASNTALVTSHLVARGYRPLADGVVPVAADTNGSIDPGGDGPVMAHPRSAPLLLPGRWANLAGLEGEPVRNDTDALAIAADRAMEPEPLVGVAAVRIRRPDEPTLRQLAGFEPFEQAASLLNAARDLRPSAPAPAVELANHSRLASVAHAEIGVRTDTLSDDLAAITTWWDGLEHQ